MERLLDIVSLTGWRNGQDIYKFRTPRQAGGVQGNLLTMQSKVCPDQWRNLFPILVSNDVYCACQTIDLSMTLSG